VAMNPPQGQGDPVLSESPKPGQRVLVVGVDERPVDIEYRDQEVLRSRLATSSAFSSARSS
jgi:hypothetical protein